MGGSMARMAKRLGRAASHEDFRRLAIRGLPRVVFDSIDGGAGAEVTLRANRAAFDAVGLRPLQASPPISTDLCVTILGDRLRMPVLLAPCGSTRIVWPDGECVTARAAARAGTAYIVPHLGGTRLEVVRKATDGPLWFQIYQYGGAAMMRAAAERAWNAGYRTLVATIDNARAVRERDIRNGMDVLIGGGMLRSLPYLPQLLARPGWLWRFLRDGGRIECPNAILPDGRAMNARELGASARQPGSYFTWADIEALRASWAGKLVVKGVLTGADARRADDCGADGIVVSNHGGRTVDGIEASLRALPEVAAAAPKGMTILLDSGVRRGNDVIRALCLGAHAVMIGRPYMFALSHGEAGVVRLLELIEDDLHRTLAGLGCGSAAELGPQFVRLPQGWASDAR